MKANERKAYSLQEQQHVNGGYNMCTENIDKAIAWLKANYGNESTEMGWIIEMLNDASMDMYTMKRILDGKPPHDYLTIAQANKLINERTGTKSRNRAHVEIQQKRLHVDEIYGHKFVSQEELARWCAERGV